MASHTHTHVDARAPPLRLPRLSYRNKCSDSESITTVSTEVSRTTASTNLTSPLPSPLCPSPREPSTDMSILQSSRRPSIAVSSQAPRAPMAPAKKKSGFFSGLLGAKEPSAQAFAEYQKTLMKHGHGRSNPVGLPGVSSAKLPPTVPKVNSKWDGVPQTLKEKEKRQEVSSRKSMVGHGRGVSTSRSVLSGRSSIANKRHSQDTLGGLSTHSSSSNQLAELYGWERKPQSSSSSVVIDFASEHRLALSRPTTARCQTSHSAPAPSERAPPLETTFVFPPHDQPLPLPHLDCTLEQHPPSLSDSPKLPSHSNSPALTPYESLPATPDAPSPITPLTSPHLDKPPQDGIRTTILEAPSDKGRVIVRSSGPNILGPPATAKRRHKLSPYQHDGARPSTSGLDMQLQSILKKEQPKQAPSPRPTLSTYSPSPAPTASASPLHIRQHSAHERLGLGANVKTQTIAPWLTMDPATDDERRVTPTPLEGGRHLRRKSRISLFKK